MTRKLILLVLFSFLLIKASSQQNALWYFGRQAALSFVPGSGPGFPSPLTNSAMNAGEGCSSICDSAGNLLFYTNGEVIYNKNHQMMQNGDNLMGHISAFQSSAIIQQPDSRTIFYVFTADAYENSYVNGYRYSIVDMNGDNGNGAVTTKNILLQAPSTERLAIARHANGIDMWVITNDLNSDIFRAWLITCNGLQPAPVISSVGAPVSQGIGALKASPDGTKLCQTQFPDPDIVALENFFQVFDLDNATGNISNARSITISRNLYNACEFSSNSQLLYVTKALATEIDQFQIGNNTGAAIIASRISIPAVKGLYGMQLGNDQRIYVSRIATKLSVINQPDNTGPACSFEADKIDLGGRFSGINLPTAVNDFFVLNFTYQILDSCNGVVQFFGTSSLGGGTQWNWDFGDATVSNQQNPVHTFSQPNNLYKVKLKTTTSTTCGFIEKGMGIIPGGVFADANFDFVIRCDSGYVRFINQSTLYPDSAAQFAWSFGDGNLSNIKDPVHSYNSSGFFTAKLKINTGQACLDDSMSSTFELQQLNIQASPDQTIDAGQSVPLTVTGGGNSFIWTPSTWLDDPRSQNPVAHPLDDISYIVTATNDVGCKDVDTVKITVNAPDGIYIPTGFTPNNDGLNDGVKPILGLSYSLVEYSIYNRWGQKMFSTTEKGKAWDGKINGKLQSSGTYIWIIRVKDSTGNLVEKKGFLTLVL